MPEMELTEIFPADGERQSIYCGACNAHMFLSFEDFEEDVSGIRIAIKSSPILKCSVCGYSVFPDHSRLAIIRMHEIATNKGVTEVSRIRRKPETRFGLTNVEFLYDSDDYEYIPGLERVNDTGFLTPVFFRKEVLIKYQNRPEYAVRFSSRTYGEIIKGDEYSIAFGINRNNRLIMWLGDIAALPVDEQHYLRSENVPSDHDIGSEFYDGQIEAQFTKPPPEDLLIAARKEFLAHAQKKFGSKLDHLSVEIIESIRGLTPPIVETEDESGRVIRLLNQIVVESINNGLLETLLSRRAGDPVPKGSLKRLQKFFEIEYPNADIHSTLSPFFVLYDLRVLASHLIPQAKKEEEWNYACERLGISNTVTRTDLYNELLRKLTSSYGALTRLFREAP